jgi:hypothetical protein
LWAGKKKQRILAGLFLLLASAACPQTPSSPDSLVTGHKSRLHHELDYSFSFSNHLYVGWHHDPSAGDIVLLQNLNYKFAHSFDSLLKFSASLSHDLGIQSYFDSITKVHSDDNTLHTSLDVRMTGKLSFSIVSNLKSQLLNGYDYRVDQTGATVRTLNSSFLTPLLWTFSGGLLFAWPSFGSLSLGISSAKLTYIRDRSIFEKQKTGKFYGVTAGKNHLFEYGLSLQLLVDKDLFKRIRWNCDLLLFKNYSSAVDMTLKNNFGIRINSFLKAGIQTRVLYEEMVSKSIQLENLVTIGVFFHL